VNFLQAEAELAQQTPGRIAPSAAAGSPVIIPRLPHNPTRVDRLYVESLREHSKVYVIVTAPSGVGYGSETSLTHPQTVL